MGILRKKTAGSSEETVADTLGLVSSSNLKSTSSVSSIGNKETFPNINDPRSMNTSSNDQDSDSRFGSCNPKNISRNSSSDNESGLHSLSGPVTDL